MSTRYKKLHCNWLSVFSLYEISINYFFFCFSYNAQLPVGFWIGAPPKPSPIPIDFSPAAN